MNFDNPTFLKEMDEQPLPDFEQEADLQKRFENLNNYFIKITKKIQILDEQRDKIIKQLKKVVPQLRPDIDDDGSDDEPKEQTDSDDEDSQ